MDEASKKEAVPMIASAVAEVTAVGIEAVFRAHHARVFRAAYRITGNLSDAEDVLQTVFLRLIRQGWLPASAGNLEMYLHRAAVNAALDLVRIRHDSGRVPLEEIEPVLRADARLDPDRRQSAGELRSLLRKAIARLTPVAAEMFALRYFEGYENPEIARMLGTSVNNVAVTLHRTRSQLQMEMRSYMETGYEH